GKQKSRFRDGPNLIETSGRGVRSRRRIKFERHGDDDPQKIHKELELGIDRPRRAVEALVTRREERAEAERQHRMKCNIEQNNIRKELEKPADGRWLALCAFARVLLAENGR